MIPLRLRPPTIIYTAATCWLSALVMNYELLLTGMHLWRSDHGPFIRGAQLSHCRRLIVVPLSTFHRLAEQIGDPQGQLVFLYFTVRCGSTLLTQVVHRITLRLKREADYIVLSFSAFTISAKNILFSLLCVCVSVCEHSVTSRPAKPI